MVSDLVLLPARSTAEPYRGGRVREATRGHCHARWRYRPSARHNGVVAGQIGRVPVRVLTLQANADPFKLTRIQVCAGCASTAFGINNSGTISGLVIGSSGPAAFFGTLGNYIQSSVPRTV